MVTSHVHVCYLHHMPVSADFKHALHLYYTYSLLAFYMECRRFSQTMQKQTIQETDMWITLPKCCKTFFKTDTKTKTSDGASLTEKNYNLMITVTTSLSLSCLHQ